MQFPFRLASLIPFWRTNNQPGPPKFNFTRGDDVFSPMDLVSMSNPGTGIANPAGDLFMLPIKIYNETEVEDRHSVLISSLGTIGQQTHEFTLSDRDSIFWLDSRTIGHISHNETEENPYEKYDLKALSLDLKDSSDNETGYLRVLNSSLVATLPTTGASDFRYLPRAQRLIFYDQIPKDVNFTMYRPEEVVEQLEDPPFFASIFNRLNEPDPDLNERPTLLSVSLSKTEDDVWVLGTDYTRLTPHEPSPDIVKQRDYDLSESHIIYKTDAEVEPSGCNCELGFPQDIYVNSIDGSTTPRQIASARFVTSPRLNDAGTKAAWFEDNSKIVIYDIVQDIEFTLIDQMDVHPTSLVFSKGDDILYFIGGNDILVSVYSLPIHETPLSGSLNSAYPIPSLITETTSLRGVQSLPNGNILATRLSYASPNEVVLIHDPQGTKVVEQTTHINDDVARRTNLTEGEAFVIPGMENAHGWILKPKGWVKDDGIKRPAILIHYRGPGAWRDQWSKLSNPNVFAAQGFFVVLISTNPLPQVEVCSAGTPQKLAKLSAGWNHILLTYPEIDRQRTIFIDEDSNEAMLCAVTKSGSKHGLQFKLALGIFSTDHNLSFRCLDRDGIYRAYDFLQSVTPKEATL